VACYDIGLTVEQRRVAAAIPNLAILDLPDDPLIGAIQSATRHCAPLLKPGKRIWCLWICPLLIRAAPFEQVFWLDCDILVLRGLDELFEQLADGPVFTPENKAPELTPNSARLYELLPIRRDFDPQLPTINAGVSGWRRGRDDEALEAYIRPVVAAARDPEVMRAISWHDQGSLIWAIQHLGLEHRVVSSPLWNLCVDHVELPPELMTWDIDLCDRLRLALPHVRLLHWNGRQPPWMKAPHTESIDGFSARAPLPGERPADSAEPLGFDRHVGPEQQSV
jgi:hypothetical protein